MIGEVIKKILFFWLFRYNKKKAVNMDSITAEPDWILSVHTRGCLLVFFRAIDVTLNIRVYK
jgi:hypothetical protein